MAITCKKMGYAPKRLEIKSSLVVADTFRLTHGGNRIYCYFDGEFVDSYRIGKVRRVHTFGKWGWMIRGTGRFKVDYLMVLGKKQ